MLCLTLLNTPDRAKEPSGNYVCSQGIRLSMKQLRKVIFWLHLLAGTLGGIVILIMSVTGVLLVYERQITAWVDRSQDIVSPSPGATRLPVETLLVKVREVRTVLPSAITLRSDPSEPAALNFGRDRMLFVNPYTGEVFGEGSQKIRVVFPSVTDWHRWLGAQSASRDSGRAITGACNLIFLFLVISGPYLWWPRTWTWSQVRGVTWFRRRLSGKSRDFNWHNVIGFWSAVTAVRCRIFRCGDLVPMGQQPRLSCSWREAAGTRQDGWGSSNYERWEGAARGRGVRKARWRITG